MDETMTNGLDHPDFEVTLLEPRPFRPFKSSEEYLYAMKEDLAEWLNGLYGLDLDADNFLEQMETGVILCQHANNVIRKAREYYRNGNLPLHGDVPIPDRDVVYRRDVLPETFPARDNVSNFISWCRWLRIKECLLFETDDLVLRKNERSFILCLLEVGRRGVQFGMPAPLLVQLEQEIDAEIANDDDGYDTMHHRQPQVVTNDLRSLHQRVVELLSRCTCPSQFPMIRVADGKYRIGDTKVLIFVRILRSHVMVRVGGGWDTLAHYLDKHDPCRCRSGHRLATSAKLTMLPGKTSIPSMHVTYNRPPQAPSSTPSSPQNHRRYMSPSMSRRSHQSTSPPSSLPQPLPPCSDDSSTSSLQDTFEKTPPPTSNRRRVSQNTSSDEEDGSEEDLHKRTPRRRSVRKEGDVPSSWKYTSGIPRKDSPPQPASCMIFANGQSRKMNQGQPNGRLPEIAARTDMKEPPKVGKVSPRIQAQQISGDQRSQSSEDLYHDSTNPGPAQPRSLIFHSRGPSPINVKGRSPAERVIAEGGFRRCDPKRHSSPRLNHRSDPRLRLSPPKPPLKLSSTNGASNRRMFWSPERQHHNPKAFVTRKNSAPTIESSPPPVFEKLLQHSDLCSDKNFLMKIEQLIDEFQAKTKMDDYGQFSSLPVTLEEPLQLHIRRSPVDNSVGKSPSKIPMPTWYSKCQS